MRAMRNRVGGVARTVLSFAQGVRHARALFREPILNESSAAAIRERTANRAVVFLDTVERTIFGHPESPYRPLLERARVDLPRLKTLVAERGVEETLHSLAGGGVHVSIEEFKGSRELQRGNVTYRVATSAFRNPIITSGLVASSGGSRSRGVGTPVSPTNHRLGAQHLMFAVSAYGLQNAPVIVWLAYAHGASLWAVLALLAAGNPVPYWFSQVPVGTAAGREVYARHLGIRAAASLHGVRVPSAAHVPLGQEASLVGRVLDETRKYQRCGIFTTPSTALRLALAAKQAGTTLEGVTFVTIAEPLTPAKMAEIHRVGAQAYSALGFAQHGRATYGCARPDGIDDGHVCLDTTAVIERRRAVDRVGTEVDALLFTALGADSRSILLNVESGDYARLTTRRCGCPFETLGWTQHLRDIRSFEKLNAEGPGFSGSKLISLVEEIFPQRFGGDGTDYQLLEEEDHEGFTRLSILVHPRLGPIDETKVLACASEQLWTGTKIGARIWADAGTVNVRRAEPMLTKAGKLLPLHHLSADSRT